jgi:late competence protein required for DNA uptake (superfamily II DNA/RNA helicase)
MLTNAQKADLLRQAIDALENADAWIQEALGDTDVCFETHNRIQDLVDDLTYDVMELEGAL